MDFSRALALGLVAGIAFGIAKAIEMMREPLVEKSPAVRRAAREEYKRRERCQ